MSCKEREVEDMDEVSSLSSWFSVSATCAAAGRGAAWPRLSRENLMKRSAWCRATPPLD